MKRIFSTFLIFSLLSGAYAFAGTLSCSIQSSASCLSGGGVVVVRLSSLSDAHAELPSQSTGAYASNVICCSGVTSLSNSCSGTYAVVLALQQTTNSHVQTNAIGTYTNNVCLSVPTGSTISVGYQDTDCSGYDTMLGSISATTDAHVGTSTDYTKKICASGSDPVTQSLSFAILSSTSTSFSGAIYFGPLSTSQTSYASSTNTNGDSVETVAHNVVVNTNAASGFSMAVRGNPLSNGSHTITALGSNTAPSIGVEQFGLRATVSGGTGTVTAPYAASGFAYTANASTASEIGSETTGDGATSTYAIRYMANIDPSTAAGSYSASLVYVVTANF